MTGAHPTCHPPEFTPLSSIPADQRRASAAAAFLGRHGDVSARARRRGVFRQTLYREAYAARAALADRPGPRLRAPRPRLAEQPRRLDHLQQQLRHAVVVAADRQAEFAATAQALGVSLSAAHAWPRVLLGGATPSRPTRGRRARGAARRAGAALAVPGAFSRPRARQVAAGEIFAGRRPVLMTVAQDSVHLPGPRAGKRSEARSGADQRSNAARANCRRRLADRGSAAWRPRPRQASPS
jgi:hypothetical protein